MLRDSFRIAVVVALILTLLCAGRVVQAQPHFGVTIGPNYTALEGVLLNPDNIEEELNELRLGFYFGFYTGVQVKPFRLRTGASFVNSGAIFNGSRFLEANELNISFLSFPVELLLQLPISRLAQPYVFGGLEFRYLLERSGKSAFYDAMRQLDTTGSVGLGIRLDIPRVPFRISPELRYAVDVQGLLDGDIRLNDELIRVREAFKADMVRIGVVLDFR